MIENGHTGMTESRLTVNRPGERVAFRISLPEEAERLLRASVDVSPGPAGASFLDPQRFGYEGLGIVTLREDAPGDFIWQEQIRIPAADEGYRAMGLASPAPAFYQPFRPAMRSVSRKVRSKFLRGVWQDMINKATGAAEDYSVLIRVWYGKGGGK